MHGRISTRSIMVRLPSFQEMFLIALEYLWCVFVVLDGNSMYHSSSQANYRLLEISAALTMVLLACHILFGGLRVTGNSVIVTVVLVVYSSIYLAVRENKMMTWNFLMMFVVGLPSLFLLFSTLYRAGRLFDLMRRLFDVVVVLAVISLYYWVFGVILQLFQPNMGISIHWGQFSYAPGYDGLHFAYQVDTTFFPDQGIIRNSGIFTEAPMFNLWLDLALAGELFLKRKPSKLRVIILLITIITTLSITGIILGVVCLLVYKKWNIRRTDRLARGLFLVGLMVLLPLIVGATVHMWTLKSDTQSYAMRVSDYVGGFMLWLDYPLFGDGYANLSGLFEYIYAPDDVVGFSNTLTGVLGTGGLWIMVLYVIPHFGLLFPRLSGDKRISFFNFCYLFLICANCIFGRFLAVIMIAFGFAILMSPKDMKQKIWTERPL